MCDRSGCSRTRPALYGIDLAGVEPEQVSYKVHFIVTWIERTYHRRRRQAGLGRLTPIEYETIMNPPAALAA